MNEDGAAHPVTTAAQRVEVAVLAGGCFWGVEEILREVPGIIDTEVGTRAAGSRTRRMRTRTIADPDTPRQSA
jgi:peptide methionine sulfoxide reductase MsrA